MFQTKTPRGIRNNNPGNIRRSIDKWQGLADPDHQIDLHYFIFGNPIYGIRAIARTLIECQDKFGMQGVKGILFRWAQMTGKPEGYVAQAVKKSGMTDYEGVNMHKYADLKLMVKTIILQENGQIPYTDAQIDKALVLAGIESPQHNLGQTRTVKGAKTAAAATIGFGFLDAIQDNIEPTSAALIALAHCADAMKWLLLAITLIGIAAIVRARIDDRLKGLR